MGKLKVLPANIANMIAAGEVVQRPASVVKELMENAVDAGATRIDVAVTDAGRTLIQVIDNGCGMSPSDAVLCFERHATSKIATADDLEKILTYGFRGEALASIAAVAEITLKTRRAEDETATKVTVEAFGSIKSSAVSAPVGSNFAVRNLFYNTPARRKFLKSDNVELRHIVEEFTRVALTRPDLGFTLSHNGRDMFVLKPAKSLKFRITDLQGSAVTGEMVDLEAQTTVARISGYLGRPESARKTAGNQYFFVNGRYFRSPYLHKAVMKAYEELMPEGLNPPYFIFLEVDPLAIDVNIHPTKTEIKFEDDTVLFQILYACVKETLGKNSFGASIDFDTEGAVELPQLGRSFEEYKGVHTPKVDFDPDYDPFASAPGTTAPSGSPAPDPSRYIRPSQDYGARFEQKSLPASRCMVLQGKYILTPVASGVMAVNIRRARERILYERALSAIKKEKHITQTTMFPVQVQVGVQNRLLFDTNAALLESLGFDIAPFGNDTVVVNGVPEGFSCETGKVEQMVSDLTLVLSDSGSSLQEMIQTSMAEKFSTLGSMSGDEISSPLEAQQLIDALFACDNTELTYSGKRIVSILTIEDLDKRF